MTQLRLTQSFAQDLNITSLDKPKSCPKQLDDWAVDCVKIQDHKVASLTHVHTLLTFFVPYQEAKLSIRKLPAELENYFIARKLYKGLQAMRSVFQSPERYTKTEDRQVLGYIREFKRSVISLTEQMEFKYLSWKKLSRYVNHTPIPSKNLQAPNAIMKNLISKM